MKILKTVLTILVLIGLSFYVKANLGVRIFKNNCIVHDPKTIQNMSCTVKAISRSTTAVNINGYIIRNVSNLFINAILWKKSDLTFQPYLVNITFDYCEYFANKATSGGGAYMRLIAPLYLPYTNMNHTCPYYGYGYLKELPIDASKIPQFWPSGVYRLDLLAFQKNYGNLLTIQLFFELKETRNRRI